MSRYFWQIAVQRRIALENIRFRTHPAAPELSQLSGWGRRNCRLKHFVKHAADRARWNFHIQHGSQCRSGIVEGDSLIVAAGPDSGTHENQGDVIVVIIWCAVCRLGGSTDPVGLEENLQIARPACIEP